MPFVILSDNEWSEAPDPTAKFDQVLLLYISETNDKMLSFGPNDSSLKKASPSS